MKKVWLINQYAMPPKLESRLRTIKFAQYLTNVGYDVTIFASSIMHNMDMNIIEDGRPFLDITYGKIHFVHINCQQYHKTAGFSRIISSIQFSNRFVKYSKQFGIPDIMIQTATVPFGNRIIRYAKSIKCKYIVEVLDLWPQSLVDVGITGKNNPFLSILYSFEKRQYAASDELVFSMEGGKDYLKDRKWDIDNGGPIDLEHVHYLNNGVDLSDFDLNKDKYKLDDVDLVNPELKKIIYIGSVRKANGLMNLIQVAALLKDEKNVVFLIYGDGDERQPLINYCQQNGINNVLFKQKWIEPKYVPYVVSCAYLNILNYTKGFGSYGGSQSKLFQYMASGKPICCNLNMMYDPIKKYNIGISYNFISYAEYANAVCYILHMPQNEYVAMCKRARQAASDYDYSVLTKKMIEFFK